jgi:hypothetical protein
MPSTEAVVKMMHIGSPEHASKLNVYQYHFLDDLSFVRNPHDVFTESAKEEVDAYLAALRERFTSAGWEGDGKIGVIWFPPFVDVGIEDTWGTYVWHVKQSNNGTSWLAAHEDLTFKRLREQNETERYITKSPVSIMFTPGESLIKQTMKVLQDLSRRLKALRGISDPAIAEVAEELLIVAQGDLVAQLNYYLDDCYLQLLLEIFENGNVSGLQLGKFKANLNPQAYIPELNGEDDRESEVGQWFTMKGLIRDILFSYKFEPFKTKTELLFKACDFQSESDLKRELTKHVQLRNCVQHHDRHVTEDSLRQAGLNEFILLEDDKSNRGITAGSAIKFTPTELKAFGHVLHKLAAAFDEHAQKRIRARYWISSKEQRKRSGKGG